MTKKLSTKRIVKNISLIALFSALSLVLALFVRVPYSAGGYFNLGDTIILLSAFMFPTLSPYIAIISGVLSDLLSGSLFFLPFTIFAKLSLVLPLFLFHKRALSPLKSFLLSFIGIILQTLIYFPSYYLASGKLSYLSSLFDFLQGLISLALSFVFASILKKKAFLAKRL